MSVRAMRRSSRGPVGTSFAYRGDESHRATITEHLASGLFLVECRCGVNAEVDAKTLAGLLAESVEREPRCA